MKHRAIIFIAAILLLCLLPSVGMLALGPSEARANELAPKAPSLLDDGRLDPDFLSSAAAYADESFAFRQELITLWARVEALFGQSAEDGVILGSGGWLYYADELADYAGVELMTQREIFSAARNLALMAEYVEGLGADFVFTIAPNKSSLYPGQMPDYPRSGAESNSERLAEALAAEGLDYVDLFALFSAREETLYFEHDSHWTSRGAALAADALNAALGVESSYAEGGAFEASPHTGDLFEMLYPAASDPETDGAPVGLDFSQGEGIRPDSITIDTVSDGEGCLLMFRDSFGELLYPFLADSWGSARFSRQSAYDLRAAQELGADAVAVEIVERNLYWLCEQAALFPAQLRELETAGAIPGSADMDIEPDKAGGHVVSGGIFGDIDVDSPVYIEYNGACYEALLINGGYSALLPGEGGGDYGVCWYSGGSLVRADISI